jgi:Flp pilus assembly protein TadB
MTEIETVWPLPSEQVVLAAPLSWAGSTRRIWRNLRPGVDLAEGWRRAGRWTVLWLALAGAWLGVAMWYMTLASLVLPLLVLIIFRIVRRTQRRGDRNRQRHAELMGRVRDREAHGTNDSKAG